MCFPVYNYIGVSVPNYAWEPRPSVVLFCTPYVMTSKEAQCSIDTLTNLILEKDPRVRGHYTRIWLDNHNRKKPFMHPDEEEFEF